MKQQNRPQDIFNRHLELRQEKSIEEDIRENYSEQCVVMSNSAVFYGWEGVRESARLLESYIGDSTFEYVTRLIEDEVAFLVWHAARDGKIVCRGADSFVFRDNKISVHTAYYRME